MQTNNLGLNLPPPPEEPSTQSIDFSVEATKSWYNGLKTADLSKSATDLIERLSVMHHANIDPGTRLQLLEIIRPFTQVIHHGLKKHYIDQITPLSEPKIAKLTLSINLQIEMLYGYKIIIENIESNNQASLKKSVLPETIYLAFKHYNNLLSNYYNTYTQVPENVWKEIHIIFKYAVECNIQDNKIDLDNKDGNIRVITPYKQALFVASTRPYQWRHLEQDMLYSYGVAWEKYITLRKFKTSDKNSSNDLFFVPINEDSAPFVVTIDKLIMEESGYTLDLSKLTSYLKKIEGEQQKNSTHTIMANYSLQKLIYCLLNGNKRRLERFKIMGKVLTSFGFPATHYYINKKRKFNPESIGTEESDQEHDSEELQLGTNLDNTGNDADQKFKAGLTLYQCKLTNIHGEGAGITFENTKYPPIQPGEIVAMAFADDEKIELDQTRWNIGTIRWLQHNRAQQLLAGIEILAPFAIAAAIQLIKQNQPVGYFQRAFLLQVKKDKKVQFNIITPIVQFETGKQVKIYSYLHKKEVETKLKELLTNNNNFKCFAIDLDLPTELEPSKLSDPSDQSTGSDLSGDITLI